MNSGRRLAAIVAVATLLLAGAPASAAGGPASGSDGLRLAARSRTAIQAPSPCSDSAYRTLGARWSSTYKWWFRAASTPTGLNRGAVRDVIRKGFGNITGANNDCGRGDSVAAQHSFRGKTTRTPSCNSRDGYNVIGFKRLQAGTLAVTCWWSFGARVIEADMIINNRYSWALSLAGCFRQPMLEAVVTHEAGHVFGLDHVAERRHGRLTMSTYLDGDCNNNEATLGLGDMRGLEDLY